MAEISRVAQAAMRSATLLRATPIPSQPYRSLVRAGSGRSRMSTTSILRSPNERARPTLTSTTSPSKTQSKTQHQSYASWTSPDHTQENLDSIADINIRKPKSSAYEIAFGGQDDKGQEIDGEKPPQFASDIFGIEFSEIKPDQGVKREPPPAPRAYLRMVPRTGRTVHVTNNVDVARSFKMLAVQVAQNGIRRESQQQRFHERPGKKRKRLRSERWRVRFSKGFKATISRVRELTAQGW